MPNPYLEDDLKKHKQRIEAKLKKYAGTPNTAPDMKKEEQREYILKKYLTDFTDQEINSCVCGAYTGTFDDEKPAAIAQLGDNINILELWHGPTCAFKDLALQLLPYLLTTSTKKVSNGKKTVILVLSKIAALF